MDLDDFGSLLFFLVLWSYMACRTPKERIIVLCINMGALAWLDWYLDGAMSRGYF